MKPFLLFAAVLGLFAPASWAQDGAKEKKKGDVPRDERKDEKKEGKVPPPCGKGRPEILAEMKKQGLGGDGLEASVDGHFKAKHPEGHCHCACGHEKESAALPKPGPREGENCGKTVKQILEGGPRIDESKVVEHFKRQHPKGEPCHCNCGHEKEGGKPPHKPEKGNNGVGNGEDPQPPGKPPVNDGPGAKPGAPGNRGGDKR